MASRDTTSSTDAQSGSVPFFNIGQERAEAAVALQKELLEAYEQASRAHTAPVEQFPIDRWDAVIAINLSSNFHAIRAVIPQMRQRNWGRIINIASTHGLVAPWKKPPTLRPNTACSG
jgi:NAD(P)-dependent dehydrogenase (short-subunit alcohol dehydrogenase family)